MCVQLNHQKQSYELDRFEKERLSSVRRRDRRTLQTVQHAHAAMMLETYSALFA